MALIDRRSDIVAEVHGRAPLVRLAIHVFAVVFAWIINLSPHLGQKRRRVVLPLFAVLTYSATSPLSERLAF